MTFRMLVLAALLVARPAAAEPDALDSQRHSAPSRW
jgi:hypothetical protein